jgi:hypothetical protein
LRAGCPRQKPQVFGRIAKQSVGGNSQGCEFLDRN